MNDIFIGLISGTSADGIDAAALSFNGQDVNYHGGITVPYPDDVRGEILNLSQPMASDAEQRIDRLGHLDRQVGKLFANAAQELCQQLDINLSQVTAIGSHGQTVRHRPQGKNHFTMQIGDPNVIAYETKRAVVADFRRMDIAAGGQGAPLVPLFHQLLFGSEGTNKVVLNLGGIANITVLPANGSRVRGFDTGPANALLDHWYQQHKTGAYDEAGDWGAAGKIHKELLKHMLADPYFSMPPPKSTGREYFDAKWLRQKLKGADQANEQDVQTTLVELTVQSIAKQIRQLPETCDEVVVCGGGAHNLYLLERLQHHLDPIKVSSLTEGNIPGDFIEAATFAWLAERRLNNVRLDYRGITGAKCPLLMGAVFDSGLSD